MRSGNRNRVDGLNVNQLIILATGMSPDAMNATAIGDFLVTTSVRNDRNFAI